MARIRKLRMGEAKTAVEWRTKLEQTQSVCFPRDVLPPFMFKSGYHVWVAIHQGRFAGYARARVIRGTKLILRLEECAVWPAFRGHNIQRELIAAREAWGRRQGAQVSLTYTVNNPASEANLKHAGYTLRQDPTANVWRKEL